MSESSTSLPPVNFNELNVQLRRCERELSSIWQKHESDDEDDEECEPERSKELNKLKQHLLEQLSTSPSPPKKLFVVFHLPNDINKTLFSIINIYPRPDNTAKLSGHEFLKSIIIPQLQPSEKYFGMRKKDLLKINPEEYDWTGFYLFHSHIPLLISDYDDFTGSKNHATIRTINTFLPQSPRDWNINRIHNQFKLDTKYITNWQELFPSNGDTSAASDSTRSVGVNNLSTKGEAVLSELKILFTKCNKDDTSLMNNGLYRVMQNAEDPFSEFYDLLFDKLGWCDGTLTLLHNWRLPIHFGSTSKTNIKTDLILMDMITEQKYAFVVYKTLRTRKDSMIWLAGSAIALAQSNRRTKLAQKQQGNSVKLDQEIIYGIEVSEYASLDFYVFHIDNVLLDAIENEQEAIERTLVKKTKSYQLNNASHRLIIINILGRICQENKNKVV